MPNTDELLRYSNPPPTIVAQWGSLNYCWAMLDAITTSVLCNILQADPVEIGIVVGMVESLGKLEKAEKILRHRKDKRFEAIHSIRKDLLAMRLQRNAITHGHFLGISVEGEQIFSLLSTFLVDGDRDTATSLICITQEELTQHAITLSRHATTLVEMFGTAELQKLLDLPSRAASYSPPKQPRRRSERPREKRQRPQKSSPE